ncbi:uncharacterized protein TNCT_113791 [Trichonephila clavata]|uniref:Uncharacterized protein n=1 Tax=Trichonephila clavata TaxID=2740835 RepID=A0A8X6FRI1_TRICU|nr:uncharacterized protein TNCT_113791 [Trichonephila clavata]
MERKEKDIPNRMQSCVRRVLAPRSNLTPSQLVGIHQHRNWSSLDDRWSSVCSETLSAEACQVGEEGLVHMDDFFYQEPFRKWITSEEISCLEIDEV